MFLKNKYDFQQLTKGVWFKTDGQEFLTSLQRGKVHLIHFCNLESLGQGAAGMIIKILNISAGRFQILKLLLNPKDAELVDLFHHEISILNELAESYNNKDSFFQSAPICHFDINNTKDSKQIIAYVGKFHPNGNLKQWLDGDHSPLERLEICKQIINMIYILYKDDKILHMDIKPENIMLNKSGKLLLIDFADAYKIGDLTNIYVKGTNPLRTGTPLFSSQADIDKFTDIHLQYFSADERQRQEIINQLDLAFAKRIVFAAGAVCFEVLSKHVAYDIYKETQFCIDPNEPINELAIQGKGYSNSLISFLKKMIDHDPDKRPAIEELAEVWEGIFHLTLFMIPIMTQPLHSL